MEYDSDGSASKACAMNIAVDVAIHCASQGQIVFFLWRARHTSRACWAPVMTKPVFFAFVRWVLNISSANISLFSAEWPMGTRFTLSGYKSRISLVKVWMSCKS